jgi:hypothetical protein
MPRVRDARLSRLAAESTRLDSTAGLDDCTLSAWYAVCVLVHDGLVQAGVDPACATALQLGKAAIDMADLGGGHEIAMPRRRFRSGRR